MDLDSQDMFDILGGDVDNCMSPGYFSGYDALFNPYCMYLVDKPKEIMWNVFIDFFKKFSMIFALSMRVLTFLVVIIFMLSYYHACGPNLWSLISIDGV